MYNNVKFVSLCLYKIKVNVFAAYEKMKGKLDEHVLVLLFCTIKVYKQHEKITYCTYLSFHVLRNDMVFVLHAAAAGQGSSSSIIC